METLKAILLYYAIMCLVLLPFCIMALVVMYKKGILKKFDAWVDSILDGKKEPNEKPAVVQQAEEKEEKNTDEENEEATNAQEFGIASFSLLVGDMYHCRLNAQARRDNISTIEWTTNNAFVGSVDENDVLLTKKIGKIRLYFRRTDNPYDRGAAVYDITVRPTNEKWFAQQMMDFLLRKRKMTDVYVALQNRKSLTMIPPKRLAVYEGFSPEEKKMIVQADASNILERVLFELKYNTETYENLEAELKQRFEKIETEGNIDIWVHEIKDEDQDVVDLYAWTKVSTNKTLLLGIGRTWREESEKDEFLYNITMAEKMFVDLTGDEPLSPVKAAQSEFDKLEEEDLAYAHKMEQEENADNGNLSNGQATESQPAEEKEEEVLEEKEEKGADTENEEPEEKNRENENALPPEDVPEIDEVPSDDVPETDPSEEPSEEGEGENEDVDFDQQYPDAESFEF